MHIKGEALSLASYSRMLSWIIEHVDEVVLMTGHRYWQVLNTAISTDWRVREGFLAPEFQAVLARQYPRLVELFGEFEGLSGTSPAFTVSRIFESRACCSPDAALNLPRLVAHCFEKPHERFRCSLENSGMYSD